MNEQGKKRQRIYDLLNAETKPKFLLSTVYPNKDKEWNILYKSKRKILVLR